MIGSTPTVPMSIAVVAGGLAVVNPADAAIWLAASPEVEGVTGKFWNKRREIRCRFRDGSTIERLWTLVEQQTSTQHLLLPA